MSHHENSSIDKWIIGIIGALVAAIILYVVFSFQPIAKKTNRELALDCTTDMATQFHIHPVLKIVINGKDQEIPAQIGITSGCMHPLHTHDASGTIHVESPQKRDFTLADFFAVWGKPFTKNQILDSIADARHVIRETVNGVQSQNYENTVVHDGDQIVISYEGK